MAASMQPPYQRKVGQPLIGAGYPRCYQREYLKYPEVCGLVCLYGYSGDRSCDVDPKFVHY